MRPLVVRAGRGLGVVVAATLAAALLAGCSARDIGDALYAGGKIAYDSFKARRAGD